jgi:peroxiredoxin
LITIAIAAAIALVAGIILMGSFSSDSNTAPDFQLRALDGKHITLASFKGGPVIRWFMAAWYPTCTDQSNALAKFNSEFGNKVDLLVIDMWTT